MQDHFRQQYVAHSRLGRFGRRVTMAESTLREFLQFCHAPYVGFSGGKDSTACLILLSRIGRTDVPVVTQADDLDWPDKREHCERVIKHLGFSDYTYATANVSATEQFERLDFFANCIIDEREVFFRPLAEFASRRQRRGVILGLRSAESTNRRRVRASRGLIYTIADGSTRCLPIADWSGVDVFALIVSSGAPWFHLYDRDDDMPPHERRMAWLCNPRFVSEGTAAFLRRYYPEHFSTVAKLNPAVRRFA